MRIVNSILQTFEYFCQISSKLIFTILSYTVLNLVHFLRHSVDYVDIVWCSSARGHQTRWGGKTSYFRAKCINIL